jgi:diguanylate cyclase (GGDEF)-like protein/PAS domain S-box-containing protein
MKDLYRKPAELEQYRRLYERIPAICFILDATGLILGVSQFGAMRLGYHAEELIGQSIFTAFPQTRSQHSSVLSCFRCNDRPGAIPQEIADSAPVNRHHQYSIQDKDGKSLGVRAATRPVSTDSGAIVLLVWEELTSPDNTEEIRERFYAPFGANCDRIEQRIAALTAANRRLQQELQESRQAARAATQNAAALRESERRFRTIFEKAGIGIVVTNSQGKLLQVNPTLQHLLHYSQEELTQLDYTQLTHPDDLPKEQPLIRDCRAGKMDGYEMEKRFVCKDGAIVWAKLMVSIVRNGSGQGSLVIAIVKDISERKRAEAALRESEERYRSVIAAIAEGVVLQQAGGQITACNVSAEKILGLSTQQILGRTSVDPHWQAIREDGSPFPGENHPAMVTLRTGKPQSNVVMGIYKPEGTTTWISINSQPLWQPGDERPYAVVTSFSDITERKQAEAALRASEAKYRTLVEKIPAVTYVASLDRISSALYISPQIETLLGYSPQEWLDRADLWYERLYPDDRKRVLAQLRDCQQHDRTFVSEYRSVARTGEVVWVRDEAAIVKDEADRPLFLQGVVFDITERKQAEAALQQQAERERLVGAIARHVRQSLHLDRILNTTVTEVRQFLHTDRVAIYRFNPDRSGIAIVESVASGWTPMLGRRIQDPCLSEEGCIERYRQGRIQAVADIYAAGFQDCYVNLLAQFQVRANLIVPILQGKQLWGFLVAQHCAAPRQWQPLEIELLEQLATQVAIAIQQAELYEQVRHSQQRYAMAVSAGKVGVWDWDLATDEIYLDPMLKAMLGYKNEEIQNHIEAWNALIYADDRQLVKRVTQDHLAGVTPHFQIEHRMLHKDGSIRWIFARGSASRDGGGKPVRVIGTCTDITERKHAEEALRFRIERERLTSAIAQHIRRSLHLGEILDTTVSDVRQLLQADRVLLLRLGGEGIGEVVTEAVDPNWSATLGTVFPDNDFPPEVYDRYCQGQPRAIDNIHSDEIAACLADYLQQLGVKSKLVVPILQDAAATVGRSKLWGLLIVHQCRAPRQWQTFEIELLQQLAMSVAIAIQQAELYQQLEVANQQLKHLATLDGLTQLANRRKFDDYLEQEWRRLAREGAPLSLILGDIDFFKRYNDTYGHQKGDECLQQVARALEKAVKRPADLVARYGGEEFAAILPNTPAMGAMQVAESIRANVRELAMNHADSEIGEYVTLSLGVASLIPSPDRSPVDLIAAADKALYRAKEGGRDRVILYPN